MNSIGQDCESALIGIPAHPDHLSIGSAALIYPYPEYRELGDRPREYLLEVARAGQRDSWTLVGDRGLVEDICREFEIVNDLLTEEQDRSCELIAARALADASLEIARGVATASLARIVELEQLLDAANHGTTRPRQDNGSCIRHSER